MLCGRYNSEPGHNISIIVVRSQIILSLSLWPLCQLGSLHPRT